MLPLTTDTVIFNFILFRQKLLYLWNVRESSTFLQKRSRVSCRCSLIEILSLELDVSICLFVDAYYIS